MQQIDNRRSVRTYGAGEITRHQITQLLRAGSQAPSAFNQQPWNFVVVKNKQLLNALSQAGKYYAPLTRAKCAIVVLCNTKLLKMPEFLQQDLAACTQNILLEAVDLGIGACWLGVMPNEQNMNGVANVLDLANHLQPFSIISLGVAEDGSNTYIDRFDESRVKFID